MICNITIRKKLLKIYSELHEILLERMDPLMLLLSKEKAHWVSKVDLADSENYDQAVEDCILFEKRAEFILNRWNDTETQCRILYAEMIRASEEILKLDSKILKLDSDSEIYKEQRLSLFSFLASNTEKIEDLKSDFSNFIYDQIIISKINNPE